MADQVELGNGPEDSTVTDFNTYEDYFDSQITPMVLFIWKSCLLDPGQGIGSTIGRTWLQRFWRTFEERGV